MSNQSVAFTGSVPENYDRYLGPCLFEPYAKDIAARLKSTTGAVLEIACGTGIVTRQLREALPADTKLVATDLNQAMIDYARARVTANGVEWKQADAMDLPFPDQSFDAVVCQFGFMFVPDKQKGFEEVFRVLKPGGRLVFNVWDALEKNVSTLVAHRTIISLFETDPPSFYEIPFGFHDRDLIKSLLETAGFSEINISELRLPSVSPSADDLASGLVKGTPMFGLLNERKPEDLEKIRQAVALAIANHAGDRPVRDDMQALVIEAIKAG